jgi:hypothetical protein
MAAAGKQVAEGDNQPYVDLPYALLLVKHKQWSQALAAYYKCLPVAASTLVNGHELLIEESYFSPDKPQFTDLEVDICLALSFSDLDEFGWSDYGIRDHVLIQAQKALALEPKSPLANLAYAGKLERIGEHDAAITIFEQVSKDNTGDEKAVSDTELSYQGVPGYSPPSVSPFK